MYLGGVGLQTPLPDLSAFEADSSIEQKKRSHKRMPFPFPAPGAAVPAGPTAGVAAAAAAAAGGYAFGGGQPAGAFLSSSQGRPVCPSTPMKSPGMSKLFHSGAGPVAALHQPHQQHQSQQQPQHGTPMCSPTQHTMSVSASARRKGRASHGLQQATPYSRTSHSGNGTPRAPKRSNSGELLAALSRQPCSSATSPERGRVMSGMQGLTPMSSSHSSDSSEGGSSLCSSVAHSPLMDPFLFTPSLGPVHGATPASATHSLASSFNSSSGRFGLGFGFGSGGGGGGLLGSGLSSGPSSAISQSNGPHSLSMSHGRSGVHSHNQHQQHAAPPTLPRRISTSSLAPGHAQSHFASSFLNLGCIGRGSFGECYHVLQTSPQGARGLGGNGNGSSGSGGVVGQEFAVKKSIRPFKGENDRNQKLREVENWRLLMNSSSGAADGSGGGNNGTAAQQAHTSSSTSPSSAPTAPLIDPSRDHMHLVRYYDAWEESGFLYIQSELFRAGTVRHFFDEVLEGPAQEELLWIFLLDLARGVRFIHQRAQLIHLDLKWDNTFIATAAPAASDSTGTSAAAAESSDESATGILKIGDFGLSMNVQERAAQVHSLDSDLAAAASAAAASASTGAASSSAVLHASSFPSCDPALASPAHPHSEWHDDSPRGYSGTNATATAAAAAPSSTCTSLASLLASAAPEIAEGDQTYLAPEFMDPTLLEASGGSISTAADIFSMGMMMFEAAFDVELPRRGPGWIDLRNERIDWSGRRYQSPGSGAGSGAGSSVTTSRSPELLALIQRMLRRDPSARPSIDEVLSDPTLCSYARGERGAAQRAALRALPSILLPADEARAAARAREQAVAAGAALLLQPPEHELEADLMRVGGGPAFAASASAAAGSINPSLTATSARFPSSRRGSARLGGGYALSSSSSGPVAPLLPLVPLPSSSSAASPFDEGASTPSPMEDTLPPKNLFDSFQSAGDD